MPSRPSAPRPGSLAALPNLGPASAAMLEAAGIRTPAALRALGAVEAFRRVRFARSGQASLVLLYALEAALTGERWDRLPPERRARLRAAVDEAGGRSECPSS